MLKGKNRNYYFLLSILLSFISIGITFFINIQIAKVYLRADGKTRALFGLTELLQFGYQYYISALGLVSFVLAIMCFKNKIHKGKTAFTIILGISAIVLVFIRIWRLFI